MKSLTECAYMLYKCLYVCASTRILAPQWGILNSIILRKSYPDHNVIHKKKNKSSRYNIPTQ